MATFPSDNDTQTQKGEMMKNFIYRMNELKTVRSNGKTKLVHKPTGTVMMESAGSLTKGQIHIAFCDAVCKQAARDFVA